MYLWASWRVKSTWEFPRNRYSVYWILASKLQVAFQKTLRSSIRTDSRPDLQRSVNSADRVDPRPLILIKFLPAWQIPVSIRLELQIIHRNEEAILSGNRSTVSKDFMYRFNPAVCFCFDSEQSSIPIPNQSRLSRVTCKNLWWIPFRIHFLESEPNSFHCFALYKFHVVAANAFPILIPFL